MDNQQTYGYMRAPPPPLPPPPPPPPPPTADPYQRPSPSVPPRPPGHPWPYSATQFQYQPQTQHSLSPPPPQWPPPQSSDHAPCPPHYPVHQPPPYPAHHPHYPPPHPLPPRPASAPPFYTQDWDSSWMQQSWQYPISAANNNEQDWGAKARAWLAAKETTENQNPSPQFVSGGGTEGKYQYFEQYSQANDPHTPLASISNYQLYPGAVRPQNQAGVCQSQESQYISAGQSSYVADTHVAFAARDGSHAGDSVTSINPLVHQQEVPSSYSSVAGNEEVGDRYEKYNSSSPQTVGPLPPHQHVQPLPPGQAGWMEGPHNFGSMPKETLSNLRDQTLNFAQFTRNLDPHAQPHCNISSGGSVRDGEPTVAVSSSYAWPSSTSPGAAYPLVAPSIPLVSQVDHPTDLPSPASGRLSPMFPTGPTFQPTVTTMGTAFGAGVTPPPTAIFGDAYGVSERPKKASVPNWLREEIIKNKAVITRSTTEIPKDDSQSIEEDRSFYKSSKKGYQGDSKSIDSSRSTEDEDEDEDEIEAARTAAINQEIKRVLTEVLLKVTDELFDEIATKVLNEDDLSVEVGRDVGLLNHQILPSKQSLSTPKASAKVLIPVKTKESGYGDASEQSTSSPPGDVLGLGSYASDEEDEEKQSEPKEISHQLQPSSCKPFKGNSVNDNGFPMEATEEQNITPKLDSASICIKTPVCVTPDGSVANMELSDFKVPGELASNDDESSSNRFSRITQDESNNSLDEGAVEKNDDGNLYSGKMANDDSKIQDTGSRYDKNVNKKSSFKEDHKDSKSSKERLEKGNVEQEKHLRTERTDYHNTSNNKGKEKGRTDEKVKNKRRSPLGGKEGNIEIQSDSRACGKKDKDRREDRTRDEIRERSRHKTESESSGHKRRRFPSDGARDRDSKENSVVHRSNDSGEESSDDSRRKSHHLKRRKSPSPVRSRKRHVSRSPHSKHSNRRHSPYSYFDTARGKRSASRSRSRSPMHRRR